MSEIDKLEQIKRYAQSQCRDCHKANAYYGPNKKHKQQTFNRGAACAYEDIIRHIDILVRGIYEASFERKSAVTDGL